MTEQSVPDPLTKTSLAQEQMRSAIQNIAVGPDRGRDISQEAAQSVMQSVLEGGVDEVQTAIFLIALRMKRESMSEFLGLFAALQNIVVSAQSRHNEVVTLADPFDGYLRNATITPFMAAVLAANGLNVVMHGVSSVGPKHGVTASKVYKLGGAQVDLSVADAVAQLNDCGWCYVDQREYAPSLYSLRDLRDRIVKRTALTTLERMLMPITGRNSTKLVLGYVHKAYPEIYSKVAFAGGFDSVLLLKGVEGGLAPALNKPLRRFVFNENLPSDVDASKQVLETPFSESAKSAAQAMKVDQDSVEQCLDQGVATLGGQQGVARDSLVLACAQILNAQQKTLSMAGAVEKVEACLDNGSALERFKSVTEWRK